jgi:hypothetical protein
MSGEKPEPDARAMLAGEEGAGDAEGVSFDALNAAAVKLAKRHAELEAAEGL